MKSEIEVMKMFKSAMRCYVKVNSADSKQRFLTRMTALQEVLELDEATVAEMLDKEIERRL